MTKVPGGRICALLVSALIATLSACSDGVAPMATEIFPQFSGGEDPPECWSPTNPATDPNWVCRESTNTERGEVRDHANGLDTHFWQCSQAANRMRGYYYDPATYGWNIYRNNIPGEFGHTHWGLNTSSTHSWQDVGITFGGFPRHILHEVLHKVLPTASESEITGWIDVCEGNA